MTTASICTIGDEILIGQITDTNSGKIANALGAAGIRTQRMLSIGDDFDTIVSNLDNELSLNNIVIVTGGLGPTKDDITKSALAALSGSTGYKVEKEQEAVVRSILKSRGLDALEANIRQAEVPDRCEIIVNRLGTAPIIICRFPQEEYGHEAVLYSMPGVPYEMEGALGDVLNDIRSHFKLDHISHKTIMTYGLAESALADRISEWEDNLPENMHLAYLPNSLTGVRLRLSIYGGDEAEHAALLENETAKLRILLGSYIYSEKDTSLQCSIGELLKGTGLTVSTAESCTGGMIAHLITTVPGASEYFLGSVISYSPEVKENVLGVKAATIENAGIVSSEVAAQMAEGALKVTGSTFAVSTTGWADSYGDEHEPAGTVWIGVSGPEGTVTMKKQYKNKRDININRFAATALDFLRNYIEEFLNK